jgi:ApaG protein
MLDDDIHIESISEYLPEHSTPEQDRYVFAYTITISNRGEQPAQLKERHWLITDGNGKVQEVHGEGVVGEQPVIPPGQSYCYTSSAILATPVGSMQGSYLMELASGEQFKTAIDVFSLSKPSAIN